MKRAQTWVVHPFLFALFPVVYLISRNAAELQLSQAVLPALFLILFAGIVLIVFQLLIRNIKWAAVFTSVFIVLFFSYAAVFWSVNEVLFPLRHRYLLPVYAIVLTCLFLLIKSAVKRSQVNAGFWTLILNVIASVLLLFNSGFIVYTKLTAQHVSGNLNADISGFTKPSHPPDIYFIIPDGYARADILQKVHGFDNSKFITALRQRGFYVADSSRSNYAHTVASLASLLNMEYIGQSPGNGKMFQALRNRIHHNKVFAILKQLGYHIYTFPTGHEFAEIKDADDFISFPHLNAVSIHLINMTPLTGTPLLSSVVVPMKRKMILFPFEQIQRSDIGKSPKLVYVHVVCPHPPFIFGPDGEAVNQYETMQFDNAWDTGSGYAGQVQYINKVLLATIDTIMKRSPNGLVVIQSDHGSHKKSNEKNVTGNDLNEQFSNFCAIRFPGGSNHQFYPNMTPVNTFRIIFNEYFNADYDLLPDESWFYTLWNDSEMINVTDSVR